MKRLKSFFWLPLLVLTLLLLNVLRTGSDAWTINLCAVSTTRTAQAIGTPESSFEPCASKPRGDSIFRWYGLVGRRAMLRGEYADGIHILQQLVQLRPDDMFAHFWLAQLYDQSREAALAIREYTWLADRLPSKQGGWAGIEWLDQRSKANQNLDVLLSGKKLVDQGFTSEGIEALRKLNALDPYSTLASYYLYRRLYPVRRYSRGRQSLAQTRFYQIWDGRAVAPTSERRDTRVGNPSRRDGLLGWHPGG